MANSWVKHNSLDITGVLSYPVCNNSIWLLLGKVTESGGLYTCLLRTLVCTLISWPDAPVLAIVDVCSFQVHMGRKDSGFNLTFGLFNKLFS